MLFAYQFCDKVFFSSEPTSNEYFKPNGLAFLIIYFLSIVTVVICYLMYTVWKIQKHWMLFFTIVLLGLISAFVSPPYTVPDEPVHFQTAYKLSNVLLGAETKFGGNELLIRNGDLLGLKYLDTRPNQNIYHNIFSSVDFIANPFEKELVVSNATIVHFGFIAYLPQALGITLARLCSLGFTPLIYLGILFNLLFFASCFALALKLLPFGKNILIAVALLPMCVHLSGSYTYDLTIIGLSVLLFSYIMHLIYQKPAVSVWDGLAITLLIFFLSPCKLVYYPLAFLVFLIPASKFSSVKKKYLFAALALLTGLFSLIIFRLDFLASLFPQQTPLDITDSSAKAVSETYTLSWILSHPINELRLLITTTRDTAAWYWEMMLGAYLGWQEININFIWVYIYTIIIGMSVFVKEERDPQISGLYRVVFIVIAGIIYVLITIAMQRVCTPFSWGIIVGVQGRYFTPILPLLLFAVKGNAITANSNFSRNIYFGIIMVNIMIFLNIYSVFVSR